LCSVSLVPGKAYTTAAACSVSCNLQLDGSDINGSPDFEFICGGALSTAAASRVEIIGGGTVRWGIGGAVTTGAGSKIIGDLHSVGAINLGVDTTWTGNLVSPTGAVTLGAGAATADITTDGAVTLGASATAHVVTTTGAKTLGAGAQENITLSTVPVLAFKFTGDLCNLPSPIIPGIYHTAAACVVSCKLQLDHNSETLVDSNLDPVTLWEFQCGGALSTAADSDVEFTDQGETGNVLWTIGGATATGAGSTMVGELRSTGAIITGADSTWTGDVTSSAGAAATGAGSTVIGHITAEGAIHVGASSHTGDMTSYNGAIILGAFSVTGDATPTGIAVLGDGAVSGFDQLAPTTSPSTFPVEAPSSSPVGTPSQMPSSSPYGAPQIFSGDLCTLQIAGGGTVAPGNYHTAAACALISCDLNLNGNGENNPAWKFQCGGALSTAANRKMVMTNYDGTVDVLWTIGAATGTGAGSVMVGNLDSVGAIALGAGTQWTGDLESFNGAVATGAGSHVSGNIKTYGAIGLGAGATSYDLRSTHGAVFLGADAIAQNCVGAGGVTMGAGASKASRRFLREVVV
jgi:hypothetical protein